MSDSMLEYSVDVPHDRGAVVRYHRFVPTGKQLVQTQPQKRPERISGADNARHEIFLDALPDLTPIKHVKTGLVCGHVRVTKLPYARTNTNTPTRHRRQWVRNHSKTLIDTIRNV